MQDCFSFPIFARVTLNIMIMKRIGIISLVAGFVLSCSAIAFAADDNNTSDNNRNRVECCCGQTCGCTGECPCGENCDKCEYCRNERCRNLKR